LSEQLQFEDEEVSITLRRAWDRALRALSTRVNKPTFETHVRAIRPLSLTESAENNKPVYQITLGVPSAFTREWVEKRHAPLIAGLLEEILDRDVRLSFTLLPKETARVKGASLAAPSLFDAPPPSPKTPSRVADARPAADQALGESADGDEFELTPAPAPDSAVHAGPAPRPQTPLNAPKTAVQPRPTRETAPYTPGPDAPLLNPRYTFDNFVVGPSNRLAHAGARAVAQTPGQVYNPLFVYGPSGLGKTHLMHAIGNEIAQVRGIDAGRIAYVSGEAFTSNYITSLREHRTDEFRRRWRSVDLWLVDDIQFIAGKEHTKEEFFHTFNALHQTGKQIVISSDRSPRELRMMDERLRSRFECGLIADVAPPDLETRLAILHRKAEIERMRIPDDVLLYMARLVQSNIRTLEGALVKIIACASLQNSPVTTELASSILEHYYIAAGIGDAFTSDGGREGNEGQGDALTMQRRAGDYGSASPTSGFGTFPGLSRRGGITPDIVQRVVARRFGLDPDALTGKKRDRDIVTARQVAMHLVRELTEMSLPGIGQLFGGRDHSTVAHACDRVRSQIPFDDDLKGLVEDLAIQIRSQAAGH
jgi:chromosomal replication initiator protein